MPHLLATSFMFSSRTLPCDSSKKYPAKSLAHSDIISNMPLILLLVKAGLRVALMSFHCSPFRKIKLFIVIIPESWSNTVTWSGKCWKDLIPTSFITSKSLMTRAGQKEKDWWIPKYLNKHRKRQTYFVEKRLPLIRKCAIVFSDQIKIALFSQVEFDVAPNEWPWFQMWNSQFFPVVRWFDTVDVEEIYTHCQKY